MNSTQTHTLFEKEHITTELEYKSSILKINEMKRNEN